MVIFFCYFKMEDLDKLSIIHISGTKGKVSDRFGLQYWMVLKYTIGEIVLMEQKN